MVAAAVEVVVENLPTGRSTSVYHPGESCSRVVTDGSGPGDALAEISTVVYNAAVTKEHHDLVRSIPAHVDTEYQIGEQI